MERAAAEVQPQSTMSKRRLTLWGILIGYFRAGSARAQPEPGLQRLRDHAAPRLAHGATLVGWAAADRKHPVRAAGRAQRDGHGRCYAAAERSA